MVYLVICGHGDWDNLLCCDVPAVPICWDPDGNMSPLVFVSEPKIGSLTSFTSSFLPSCSPITPSHSLAPAPKSNTEHSNTSVGPRCVWCCWGYPLRSLKQSLSDGDREGWNERRERKRIRWGVPGWLCCVRPPTPDVTSFRFTSAAKLE